MTIIITEGCKNIKMYNCNIHVLEIFTNDAKIEMKNSTINGVDGEKYIKTEEEKIYKMYELDEERGKDE